MNRNRSGSKVAALVLFAISTTILTGCPSPVTTPTQYSLVILDDHVGVAKGINTWCEVVGYIEDSSGNNRAFLWDPAQSPSMIDLGTLGGDTSEANAINAKHEVVGKSYLPFSDQGYVMRAFYWNATDGMVDIGTLGGRDSYASAIDLSSRVVGMAANAGGHFRQPFIWNPTDGMAPIPGTDVDSNVLAINDAGVVVGGVFATDTDTFEAWRAAGWNTDGSLFQIPDLLGGVGALAYGINTGGKVVGNATHTTGTNPYYDGFIWDSVTGMKSISSLGWCAPTTLMCSSALAINNSDQVVGNATLQNFTVHAILWQNGKITDLNTMLPISLNWLYMSQANAINNTGCIAGAGFKIDNQGNSFEVPILLLPIVIKTLKVQPNAVIGGTPATGTITLSGKAPMPMNILLAPSGLAQAVSIPQSVTVPREQSQVIFNIDTNVVDISQQGQIRASFGGWDLFASLTVKRNPGSVIGTKGNYTMISSTMPR
jgi:probable HAF family extracellular repeat protein